MKFLAGLLTGLVVAVVLPLAYLASGALDISAAAETSVVEEKIAPWAAERSIASHAPAATNPVAPNDAAALAKGREHFKEMCVLCHGAPGVEIGEIGRGLNPVPPPLDGTGIQRMTDGQLFWIVKRGVRMTGMPAFGGTHDDAAIWSIVSFVRTLPHLSDADRAALRAGAEEHEHAEAGEHGESPAPQPTPGHTHAPGHEHH